MIKKLLVSIAVLFSLVGVAYAGCFHTQNFNKAVDMNNMRRLVLQCTAMRVGGGTWSISSGDTYMTKGSARITSLAPVQSGSTWAMDVTNGTSTIARALWSSNGYATMTYFGDGGSEAANCSVVMVADGVVNPPQLPTLHPEARYCR